MSQASLSFQELLHADLENTSQLLVLMARERKHLETRDLDAMSQLILEKAQVLAKIEKNDDQRRKLLAQANYPNTKDGINSYIENLPQAMATSCAKDFEQLQIALVKCQEINTINGIVTNRSKKRTTQSMDIIRGIAKRDTLYTKKGSTDKDGSSTSRPISEA